MHKILMNVLGENLILNCWKCMPHTSYCFDHVPLSSYLCVCHLNFRHKFQCHRHKCGTNNGTPTSVWHTHEILSFCRDFSIQQSQYQVSIKIEYTGVIFKKVIFGEDQYQCSTKGPFEWGASSGNILSNTPTHHQCPSQHQTAWRRRILKQ
jgi:hypothetical protein